MGRSVMIRLSAVPIVPHGKLASSATPVRPVICDMWPQELLNGAVRDIYAWEASVPPHQKYRTHLGPMSACPHGQHQ